MRHASLLPPQIALAGVLVMLLPLAAFSGTRTSHSRFVGTYESDPAPLGKTGPSMCISLGADGTATVTQDPGKAESTSFGRWQDGGSQVTVIFDAVAGKPAEAPMIFDTSHDALRAVTWNHAKWGKVNPPVARKGDNWHGGGHHRWFSLRPSSD